MFSNTLYFHVNVAMSILLLSQIISTNWNFYLPQCGIFNNLVHLNANSQKTSYFRFNQFRITHSPTISLTLNNVLCTNSQRYYHHEIFCFSSISQAVYPTCSKDTYAVWLVCWSDTSESWKLKKKKSSQS